MRLWYAPTSPFARKARIAAHELGLADDIELIQVDPWTDGRLRRLNPLAKVPTLERDSGAPLFESALICEYLDTLASPPGLFPQQGEARWTALRRQGAADGIATAAGRLFADEKRGPGQRVEAMLKRFQAAIDAGLDALEDEAASFPPTPTIGEIATAATLGYLGFRWPSRDWRTSRPKLAAWFVEFDARPSMQATRYRLP